MSVFRQSWVGDQAGGVRAIARELTLATQVNVMVGELGLVLAGSTARPM